MLDQQKTLASLKGVPVEKNICRGVHHPVFYGIEHAAQNQRCYYDQNSVL